MNDKELADLYKSYVNIYEAPLEDSTEYVLDYLIDEGSGWRDGIRINGPRNLSVSSTRRHLENSGRTRTPSPANLARRELQARRIEQNAKNLEARDRTNSERRTEFYSSGQWKNTPKEHSPQETNNNSKVERLRSQAKAVRTISRAQSRRSPSDEDNQRIANSVRIPKFQGINDRENQDPKSFAKSTSHLDLTRIDPDSYGTKRKTKPKSQETPASNLTRKDKKKIHKWHGAPRFADRNDHYSPKNDIKSFQRNDVEYVLDYLIDEGFTDSYDSALVILETMSEEWFENLIESAKEQSDKQIDKGVKTTYRAQNVLDNLHQGRSRGLERIDRRERDDKVKRMRGRLKTRRDDLFAERGKREDEKMAKLKKLLGM
jgi:hypothetical protein